MGIIMWATVGVCALFCLCYFFITANKTRKAIYGPAVKLSGDLLSDYPEYRRQLDRIVVSDHSVTVSVKAVDSQDKVYDLKAYGIDATDETVISEVANYLQDALKDGEWKRETERVTEDGITYLKSVAIVNMTRLSYTDKRKSAGLETEN